MSINFNDSFYERIFGRLSPTEREILEKRIKSAMAGMEGNPFTEVWKRDVTMPHDPMGDTLNARFQWGAKIPYSGSIFNEVYGVHDKPIREEPRRREFMFYAGSNGAIYDFIGEPLFPFKAGPELDYDRPPRAKPGSVIIAGVEVPVIINANMPTNEGMFVEILPGKSIRVIASFSM